MPVTTITRVALGVMALLLSAGVLAQDVLAPSGTPAHIPADSESFASYLDHNRRNITSALRRTHFPGDTQLAFQHRDRSGRSTRYTLEEAVALRMPFELASTCNAAGEASAAVVAPAADAARGQGKAFLLIHGLTDSPYLLRRIGEDLHRRFPCSLVRAILLPGHGTAPGDTLDMTHQQWSQVVAWGIHGLQDDASIDDLTLVGFSTGTPLALAYMADPANRRDKIARMAFISPAVQANSRFAFLSVALNWFGKQWLGTNLEMDAARYESFSVNAGAQFYLLTRGMTSARFPALTVPVFMAVSGDDSTISAQAAADFYCDKARVSGSRMLWYQSRFAGSAPGRSACDGMTVVEIPQRADVLSYSHVGLSIPEDDAHYGSNGRYRHCKAYEGDEEKYQSCIVNDAEAFYAESNVDTAEYPRTYLRRGTFNPLYAEMLEELGCFVDAGGC